jgi:hypothetical protein
MKWFAFLLALLASPSWLRNAMPDTGGRVRSICFGLVERQVTFGQISPGAGAVTLTPVDRPCIADSES